MKIVVSHPTGNAFVREAILGLLNAQALFSYNTTVATYHGNIFDSLSNISFLKEFNRRRYNTVLAPYIKTFPYYELGRIIALKFNLDALTKHETGLFSVDSVYKHLDIQVAKLINNNHKDKIDAVYAYEDGALNTFKTAKQQNLKCLYDLPIGYWRTARRLLEVERERWPDWMPTIIGFDDSDTKLNYKDEELKLADRIFVASSFTASTLKDFKGNLAPVEVIPYGFPPIYEKREYREINGSPIKLLFVGSLSQRKGIADLFAAVEAIGNRVELTVVGRKTGSYCPPLDAALAKHTWIESMSHSEILEIMRAHDVLVFPSLFEGFGLVITEAMSQGTPVITTDRTAGPDLINHGENGWLINAGSTMELQSVIESILINPKSIAKVGRLAMETAKSRPWEVYGQEISESILKDI